MKVAITTNKADTTAPVDMRFGRAAGFLICDTDSGAISFIDNNQDTQSLQGAGIQAAKKVIDAGAEIVISGNVGPKAFSVLASAGIRIYLCGECSVKEALEKLKKGELELTSGANVEGHW